jgi:flagella basal body P-ring formation protein FlgA
MQMLCHKLPPLAALQRVWLVVTQAAVLCLALALGGTQAVAQTAGEAPLSQESLFKEVGNWMQQNQQLSAGQFDFVPLDNRVKVQPCDRPLVMDLPFATKETVRVRCLGASSWQLYLRANIKIPPAKPATAAAPSSAAAPASAAKPAPAPATAPSNNAPAAAQPVAVAATPPKNAGVSALPRRKVVVGTQFLRAGTVLSASMLEETEQAAAGADNLLFGSVKDLENAEVVRDIPAGTALRSSDVRRALMIKQGQLVMLTISQGGSFAIVARVEALQDGRLGDQIRLKNPESGRLLSGVVTGPNAAKGL